MTDPGFANRMRDLMKYKPDFTINDVQLLKLGRYFQLAPETRFIVGRNEEENGKLLKLTREGDLCFYPVKTKGPVGIGRGAFNKDYIFTASSIIARYSDGDPGQQLEVAYKSVPSDRTDFITAMPIKESNLALLRI